MFNEMILVTVTQFSGTTTPDKNGAMPVMLQCVAGKMPNRNVLSRTVAERAGFEIGKCYLVDCREQGVDEDFGTDYTFIKVQEVDSALDIARTAKELGKPEIVPVGRPDAFLEHYQRKSDAVEGIRAQRIRDGKYKPATGYSDHSTAYEVTAGTSLDAIKRLEDLGLGGESKNSSNQVEKVQP